MKADEIAQVIIEVFKDDPVAFRQALVGLALRVELTQIQTQLTDLQEEANSTMKSYGDQLNELLDKVRSKQDEVDAMKSTGDVV